jgi:sugar phosphate isomerase/epimerase
MRILLSRRQALSGMLTSLGAAALSRSSLTADSARRFEPRYIIGSSMYGYTPLAEILPEVRKSGATAIDIWPKSHGNQREQLDELGEKQFAKLLQDHDVSLGCITQYKLGPFGLRDEIPLAQRLGCSTIVTGAKGPRGLSGSELKQAIGVFAEQMKPHLEIAAEHGVTIAIENHANGLMESPDAMKWLMELRPSEHLAIAFAPYHLEQDEKLLSDLIRALENNIAMFYAWQHGMGCMTKLPKEQELLQMPGRGDLEFGTLLEALADVQYRGWTEIFMHPVPRGIPILDTTDQVTAEINRARKYLEDRRR